VIPGVIRPPAAAPVPTPAVDNTSSDDLLDMAERGIIRGKVHMVADERTNLLIIITRPENMKFFEKIVKVLDVPTSPDVMVEVIRLEYSTAEDVASTLNTLIGAAKKDTAAAPVLPGRDALPVERVSALRDYVAQVQQERATATAAKVSDAQKSKLGELSADSIKVLPDKRTNSLLIMATKADMAAIREGIRGMDMMLSQVLIEAVIMEVELGGSIQTGIDWVQRAMVAYDTKNPVTRTPMFSFAGGGGGGGNFTPQNATAMSTAGAISPGAGLTYYHRGPLRGRRAAEEHRPAPDREAPHQREEAGGHGD
jgi:type II secretory pathway component GspD/PulD (secretin)